ncbi:MAG: N-acetylmuramoyl-L-alanine amidase [Proteobacteria bacterium]|jgi:N-acetylmuramoyl-L-alanine amidase|nr:N-acetylmuramoyl-L-alanine amidase [Alphaproteobacteria bacterium]NCC03274.1 N-acetylmuramoyl-L-alanine amidase [Pseudomonadota bacterium]
MIEAPSPNHNERKSTIRYVVLHYTDMVDTPTALKRLCDPLAEVSCHYLISRQGEIYRLVDESQRAWHAGISYWKGEQDINSSSIGIELENPGHTNGYIPFTPEQIGSLIALLKDIMARHTMPPENLLAHSDIAPDRKIDPGIYFPWKNLATEEIGYWPEATAGTTALSENEIQQALTIIGYNPATTQASLAAFQRRFAPEELDQPPGPLTCSRLKAYADHCGTSSPRANIMDKGENALTTD